MRQLLNTLFLFCLLSLQVVGQGIDNKRYVENKGQWHEDIIFRREIPSGVMYLGKGRISYLLTNHDHP